MGPLRQNSLSPDGVMIGTTPALGAPPLRKLRSGLFSTIPLRLPNRQLTIVNRHFRLRLPLFRFKQPGDSRQNLQNRYRPGIFVRIFVGQLVSASFVFIHIFGSTFIFNIFMGVSASRSNFFKTNWRPATIGEELNLPRPGIGDSLLHISAPPSPLRHSPPNNSPLSRLAIVLPHLNTIPAHCPGQQE
jgi:hypothetical protein